MPKVSHHTKCQCLYCDEVSTENYTGVTKRKYKLAGHRRRDSLDALGIKSYIYFTTTSKTHHNQKTTVEVQPNEMDHYGKKPLSYVPTYIDIKLRERIFEDELQNKINDPANGFKKVAKLHGHKWAELQTVAPSILSQRVGDTVKEDVLHGLLDTTAAEEMLERWGIAPSYSGKA